MVSRLDENQVRILHAREIELGYPGTPSMIKEKFNLQEIGEVPESVFLNAERQVIAINEKERARYKESHTGCCFKSPGSFYTRSDDKCSSNPDVSVIHKADYKIIDDGIAFQTPTTGGKAREKMQGRREEAA